MDSSLYGQSAIEYLTTYGWMLLVVAVAGGSFYSIAQQESTESVSGFTGSDVNIQNFGANSDGDLDLDVRNTAADTVVINSVNISDGDNYSQWTGGRKIAIGDSKTISISNISTTDRGPNTLEVEIKYDSGSLKNLEAYGTMTGSFALNGNSSITEENQASPQYFDVSVTGNNSPVTEEEAFNVNYTVENTGDLSGTQYVNLTVNSIQEDSESVSLNSSELFSGNLSWTTEVGDSGTKMPYKVSSSNSTVSGNLTVNAASGPTAAASSNTSKASVNDTIAFDGSSSTEGDSTISSYFWSFDDGSTGTGETINHEFTSSGNYTVNLEVEDNNGLTDSDTVDVEVNEPAPTSILFDGSDSWEVIQGSPTVDSANAEISNLRASSDGNDNMVSFSYTDETATFTVEYTQTQSPPSESTVDRYYSIIDLRRSDGNSLFDVNVVGNNDIYVYDPVDSNQDFSDKRDRNYNTGIDASGTHKIEMTWDGSAWNLNIDDGAYTRTMAGMNEPVDRVLVGGQGTSDPYLDGTHTYDLVDLTAQ